MSRDAFTALAELVTPGQSSRAWGFTRRSIDADLSVGVTLSSARVRSGRSLAALAVLIGIPERYLRALEGEDLAVLPGLVYEKHFIARYAKVLNLEPEPLIQGWVELRHEGPLPVTQFVARVHWRDLWIGPFVWRRVLALGAFLVAAVFVGGQLFSMVRPPNLVVTTPVVGLATTERTVEVAGTTESDSQVTVNGQMVSIRGQGSFRVVVGIEPGANTVRVVATKRYGRPATVERQIFVAALPTPAAFHSSNGSAILGSSYLVP